MKLNSFKILVFTLALSSTISLAQNIDVSIIPQPLKIERSEGQFVISSKTKIIVEDGKGLELLGKHLSDYSKIYLGYNLPISNKPKSGEKVIELSTENGKSELGKEGYELDIKPNLISIKANTSAGIFYGIQTLSQLMSSSNSKNSKTLIPALHIEDAPRFGWRGMMLDVSRHFYSKEFLKKFIDLLALHKMNTFHLHLVDSQGWRVEIKKYPKLTEIGAWREDNRDKPWSYFQKFGKEIPTGAKRYGGFYTQDDIKEIVKYAQERYITILPEIEMPGHSAAAHAAYPQFTCPDYASTQNEMMEDVYCAGNDSTFIFLQNVLDELIPLFPNPYFHIGGDEVGKKTWRNCPKCQKRIKDESLHNEEELQSYFIKRMDTFLASRNKHLVGWDEILEGGLAPNATVMSWRGVKGGIEAAKENHDVVMVPTTNCYFDYSQSNTGLTIEKVYEFDPIPNELNEKEGKHILGGEAALWTEDIQTPEKAEFMTLPRLAALSEAIWSSEENRSLENFKKKLGTYYSQLDKLHYNYYIPAPSGIGGDKVFIDKAEIILQKPIPNAEIRYTLDGTEPTKNSLLYTKPLIISNDLTIKACTYLQGKETKSETAVSNYKKEAYENSENISDLKPGITFKYYEGEFRKIKDMLETTSKRTGVMDKVVLPHEHSKDYYGVEYNGYIKIPADGVYTFYLSSDDGSILYIGNRKLIDHDGIHGNTEKNAQIALKKGYHSIKILYFENAFGEGLKIQYDGPNISKRELNSFFHQ